mmetsp:Transcript_9423/g.21521  ORF Transcript_9423/g.21521 Transcript_9423/m.21521 type:complete len:343 (-) Transcript_9423:879-1907(-)|eukprot:CAMPEP_0114555630 /NCGR_PEP_ID=MMETSP0114-20121206/8855_1 /TAXON_ID=31324 /ORGANISM="Goniomonas sp, Strain m" /LENGTH=342 /DNA_ID=CAMNT_0001740775 /DNA_START=39 /DNA_END=1067 /DNA_ORIENTATION=+
MSSASAEEIFQEGNALFVEEKWQMAADKFSEAHALDPKRADCLVNRSACFQKLGKFDDGLRDAESALALEGENPKALLRKGTALFSLGRASDACVVFEKALEKDPSSSSLKNWIKKCGSVSTEAEVKLRCCNIACGYQFLESENNDKACHYHPGPPKFHDGRREWGCCEKRGLDFDQFMSIPPCTYGRHNANKSAVAAPTGSGLVERIQAANAREAAHTASQPQAAAAAAAGPPPAEDCVRCKGGYMCQDHGKAATSYQGAFVKKRQEEAKKAIEPTALRPCKNKGCDAKFREVDNNDKACTFHPGAPVFHEGRKEWGCCKKGSHDFDEFLSFPGCTVGPHA